MKFFGWFESPKGLLSMAMEYCEFGDLHQWLAAKPTKSLQEQEATAIIFQVLMGVKYMHENQFAHRDLKPNVGFLLSSFFPHRHPNLTLYDSRTS